MLPFMDEEAFEECTDKLMEFVASIEKLFTNFNGIDETNLDDIVNPLNTIYNKVNSFKHN